ncbi:MAG: hypothetical protein CMN10_15145 [Roseobacter sp.]|jgi:predicted transcriptional regulator|nr:hypothetical protein [Roseobacter sp.]MBV49891.1 hypothetical protein [Roseobacter sp.]MCF7728726.1 hypothetical protein [Sulfitobacter sp. M22]|tara:strand:- start:79 stop:531 length:453 start_codon:yes stop_codon:yes gene_type:complete
MFPMNFTVEKQHFSQAFFAPVFPCFFVWKNIAPLSLRIVHLTGRVRAEYWRRMENLHVNAQPRNFRPPTDRQIELMSFMVSYFDEHGEWPSHRQMAVALDINSSNLSPYLNLLEAKGLLAKIAGKYRRNRALTDLGRQFVTDQEWQPRLL